MRFQELRDTDGAVLVRGLHPAIAVVSADAGARAAVTSAVAGSKGCTVLRPLDIEEELNRGAVWMVEQHETAVEQRRSKVAEAEHAVQEAAAASTSAAREASVATTDLACFDELADRLSAADEAYEAAVHSDAEAARSLAAALGELERILGQRHSATASLEQARKGRDHRGVPEAVLHQAMNLQAALAKAEADKRAAVRQADGDFDAARAASRDALSALDEAHAALRAGVQVTSSGAPVWGPGVPLPGLLTNYRDRLAGVLSSAETANARARSVEKAAKARVEQESHALEALLASGPPALDPLETISRWAGSELFSSSDIVLAEDTFARFGTEGVATLLTTLAGRGCQVIYLTNDPEVLGWAISLPHETGGASTITSRNRRPVLVSD